MPRTWVDVPNEALVVTGGTTPADTRLFPLAGACETRLGLSGAGQLVERVRAIAAATGVQMPGFEAPTPTPITAPATATACTWSP